MSRRPFRTLPSHAALVLLFAALASSTAAQPTPEVKIGQPAFDGKTRVMSLAGESNLPGQTILTCQIKLGVNEGPRRQAIVQPNGSFRFDFPALGRKVNLIPAEYDFVVTLNPADQSAPVTAALAGATLPALSTKAQIGEPAEAESVKAGLRKTLIDLVTQLRRLHTAAETQATYTIAKIFNARNKAGGNLSQEQSARLGEDWKRYTESLFEDNYQALRLNFQDYRESSFVSPFADVDRDLESVFGLVRKWYAQSWIEMSKMTGEPVEQWVKDEATFSKKVLTPQLVQATERIYQGLGIEAQEWGQITAFRPEEGIVKGLSYMSKTSKFTIDLPNEEWEFNQDWVHAQVRIRMAPKDPAKKQWGVVAVELRDYPDCEKAADLDIAMEIEMSERWPGYKKLSGGPMKVDDDQVDGGKRPGYDLSFITVEPDKKIFHMIDYALYCRWFKRTYSVIMISNKEHYEEFAKEFDKIKRSFKVLDKEN